MNTLRLDIINLHAPYRVRQRDDKPQTYYFKTDIRKIQIERENLWKYQNKKITFGKPLIF